MTEALPVDPFEGVVLHHTLFDWSDTTLDADRITERLIGFVDHWDLPEFTGMDPWYIERDILFAAGRNNWAGMSKYGKPLYQHMLTLIKLLFPNTDITPSLADVVMFFMMAIGGCNKKILNLIGSQNAGKSAGGVRLMFACMFIDPHYTVGYVANPFDSASDSTVWGDVEELWDELVEAHPNTTGTGFPDAPLFFPHGKKYAARKLEFIPGIPKAGTIELRNVKHVGKYKGSKTRGKDTTRGVFFLDIDEVNEIENFAFLQTLTNISSQDGFICYTSQNFKNPEDMGGRLAEPRPIFGGPSSYEDLQIDEDHFWHSAASSITLRLDGLNSPNILAGRVVYPKLFKIADRDRLKLDYGEQSPEYYSQVRSFPAASDVTNSVLSRQKISASRHKDEYFSLTKISGRVAFCDPAFGGRDKSVYGWAKFGTATVTDGEGNQQTTELLVFETHFRTIQLTKGATYNDFWFDRMRAVEIDVSDFVEGAEVSYEDQIALRCREYNREFHIPADCFGYDFSMRPDIVTSVNRFIGFSAAAFNYNLDPEGAFIQNIKKNSEDCCKNRCTELAFITADYFTTKQVRGGQHIETALTQLSRTIYETVNKKYVAEGKKEYKARWQQVSPDHRDVLMGICGMAHRKGFRQGSVVSSKAGRSVFSKISDSNVGKSRVIKALP